MTNFAAAWTPASPSRSSRFRQVPASPTWWHSRARAISATRSNRGSSARWERRNRLRIKADFNDDALLGQGNEKVDKLTNLVGIVESKNLDFSKHRADGDDILGDAYD